MVKVSLGVFESPAVLSWDTELEFESESVGLAGLLTRHSTHAKALDPNPAFSAPTSLHKTRCVKAL